MIFLALRFNRKSMMSIVGEGVELEIGEGEAFAAPIGHPSALFDTARLN